jgi:hypothetical protein
MPDQKIKHNIYNIYEQKRQLIGSNVILRFNVLGSDLNLFLMERYVRKRVKVKIGKLIEIAFKGILRKLSMMTQLVNNPVPIP